MTPNGLWEDSIKKWGPLPVYDVDTHLPRMLERTTVDVTRRGLLLGGVFFDQPNDPVFRHLKEGATTFGTPHKLAAHFDRCITRQIYIVPKNPADSIVVVPRASISAKWESYTFKEVEDTLEEAKLRSVDLDNTHHLAKIEHGIRIDEDVLKATEEMIERYGSLHKRNKIATGVGSETPRADQYRIQLAKEAAALPSPTITPPATEPTSEPATTNTATSPASPCAPVKTPLQPPVKIPLRPVYF